MSCVIPNCTTKTKKNNARGLCRICYRRAKTLIDSGKTTWAELERLGLASPAIPRCTLMDLINARRKTP